MSNIETWELTADQLDIWYRQRLHPESPIYNTGEYLEIRGYLDIAIFEAALRRVVYEADAFHLRFDDDGDVVRQWIGKSDGWPLDVIDFGAEPDPRGAAESWMRADMCRPFDLREGPIFREAVLKLSPELFLWYQSVHCIAFDALSESIIASRVARAYSALLAGQEPPAGDCLRPVSALLESYRAYRGSAEYQRDGEFWLGALAGIPGPVSVSGRQAVAASRPPRRHMEAVSPSAMAGMRQAAWRLGTSFGGLMVAAGAIYLHRVTGAEDIVIGFQVNWRVGDQRRDTPGMAANVLPIRVAVHGTTSVGALARDVETTLVDSLHHQRYPHARIRRDVHSGDGDFCGVVVNVMSSDSGLSFGGCAAFAHNLANGPVDDLAICVYPQSFRHPEGRLLIVPASVFDPHVRFGAGRGVCGVPGVPGPAPAPTAPALSSFRVAGVVRAGQVSAGRVQSRCQQVRNAPAHGQVSLMARVRWRAWRASLAGRCQAR